MFGIVLTTAYTVMLVYVLWRARSIPALKQRFPRNGVIGIGAILWAVFFFARTLGHQKTGAVGGAIEFMGMVLLGSVFLISTVLFVVELCTLFGLFFKRWRPTLFSWALVAGVIMAAFALVQGLRAPAVVSYEVALPSLPAELDRKVVVAVSDTHLGSILGSRWMDDRIAQIQALQPDLLVFIGDIFEGHGAMPNAIPALNHLSIPLGKWFVDGNHESHQSSEAGLKVLEQAGFHRLENQWAEPAPGLILSGVNDLTNHRRRSIDGDPLASALANRPEGATILLSHTPWQTDRAAQAGVELMLSGHTHGGQIWPFAYLVQRIYPFIAGRYNINGMTLLVSRGTGTWGPRMRLWHRSEIIKITLRALQKISVKHQ
ncbi:metallophosphoesterase [Desulfocurvus vexinensis]|uniref:metallophosphoesterase n=1 Tax=Desulfocurvus vexinensis TaxID=399548 RepID=UPI0009FDE558|nr:metallophosphoesterase [Desulfocurvus vexinensis]